MVHWTVVHLDGPNWHNIGVPLESCPFWWVSCIHLDRPYNSIWTVEPSWDIRTNITLCLQEFSRALPLKTSSDKGLYLTVWRSSLGHRPRELLWAKGYIWPYVPCLVLIWLQNIMFTCQYIILNNGILKFNTSVFSSSERYISQYTPKGVYRLRDILQKKSSFNLGIFLTGSDPPPTMSYDTLQIKWLK